MDFAFWLGSLSQAYPGSVVIPPLTVRIGVFYPFAKSSALKGVCMSSYLAFADNLSSTLWDMGRYYCHGLDCSGRWCVFLYTTLSKPPRLLVQGLTPRQLCAYLVKVYNEEASNSL